MSHDEFIAHVKGMTYKPGYIIAVERHRILDCIRVTVKMRTADSAPPHHQCSISMAQDYYPEHFWTAKEVCNEIRRHIHTVEMHEADEWLRYEGNLIHDPHDK